MTYSYIVVPSVGHMFHVAADVFLAWGLGKLVTRYLFLNEKRQQNGKNDGSDAWFLSYVLDCLAGPVLAFLGIYQIGLLFSLCAAWLAFAQVGVINEIAKERSAFEIAFTICLGAGAAIGIVFLANTSLGHGPDLGLGANWFRHSFRYNSETMLKARGVNLRLEAGNVRSRNAVSSSLSLTFPPHNANGPIPDELT